MDILHDKIALTMLVIISMIAVICATGADVSKDASDITGVVSDTGTTEKGSTFTMTDGSGIETRCFFRGNVNDGDVCTVKGSFSDDGGIFFVSSLTVRQI